MAGVKKSLRPKARRKHDEETTGSIDGLTISERNVLEEIKSDRAKRNAERVVDRKIGGDNASAPSAKKKNAADDKATNMLFEALGMEPPKKAKKYMGGGMVKQGYMDGGEVRRGDVRDNPKRGKCY